eukprot:superscaffoldBa00000942_g8115
MKVFAFALLLLLAATYGEALLCQNCVREAPDSVDCVETTVTCPPELNACAKITYPAPAGEYCGPTVILTKTCPLSVITSQIKRQNN